MMLFIIFILLIGGLLAISNPAALSRLEVAEVLNDVQNDVLQYTTTLYNYIYIYDTGVRCIFTHAYKHLPRRWLNIRGNFIVQMHNNQPTTLAARGFSNGKSGTDSSQDGTLGGGELCHCIARSCQQQGPHVTGHDLGDMKTLTRCPEPQARSAGVFLLGISSQRILGNF